MSDKKRFKSYMKGFGAGLFFPAVDHEARPTKAENKYMHRGFVSGAIIGSPLWIPATYLVMLGYGLITCPGRCISSCVEAQEEQEAWERKRYG